MTPLKDLFLLDPEIIFLNHGSFGATPRPVFETYQAWQRKLERQPVRFLARELLPRLKEARRILAHTLQAGTDNLVYIPNTTFGVNLVARSLPLQAGDEILTSNHEYGACDNAWAFVAQKTGATYTRRSIPLRLSGEEIASCFLEGITPQTKIIFLSHITSQTALRMPVEAICQEARGNGILTLVDGAHAPGQILLNLPKIGADFYVGNCHKWLMAPKGSAFVYARPEHKEKLDPLVVGWGWGENASYTSGSNYIDKLEWLGTNDPAAYLSVPSAIQFQKDHNWPQVRKRCHRLLKQTAQQACQLTGLPSTYTQKGEQYHQMAVVPLPPTENLNEFQKTLYERYQIEIPTIAWQGRQFLRISVQGYNTEEELASFLGALEELLR